VNAKNDTSHHSICVGVTVTQELRLLKGIVSSAVHYSYIQAGHMDYTAS